MVDACPICQSPEGRVVFRELEIDLIRCLRCTHVYSTWESPSHYDGYWEGNIEVEAEALRFYWSTAREPSYGEVLARLDAYRTDAASDPTRAGRGRILDVGCGVGFFPRFAADAGWQAWGYEISKEAVAWGQRELELDTLCAGRVEDSGFSPGSFDVVTLWDVIEHISEPVPLLRYCRTLLRPGGVLFIQTPNANFQLLRARLMRAVGRAPAEVSLLEVRDHVNDFTVESMRAATAASGFRDCEFFVGKPTYTLGGGRSRLGLGLKLGYYHVARAASAVTGGRFYISNTVHAVAHGGG